MPAKAPMYLKPGGKNGAGAKGPKKLREILSTDMISPPLGDFRHMAHVGRGGNDDMFGDTSFLQKGKDSAGSTKKNDNGNDEFKRGGSLGKKERSSKKSRASSHEQSATLDRPKRSKHGDKLRSTNGTSYGPETSPVLQSAFSLPILNDPPASPSKQDNIDATNTDQSSCQESDKSSLDDQKVYSRSHEEVSTTHESDSVSPSKTPNGIVGGPPKPRRIMTGPAEKAEQDIAHTNSPLADVDKLSPLRRSSEVLTSMPIVVQKVNSSENIESDDWGFDLDLGPSLMDEIMGMMSDDKK